MIWVLLLLGGCNFFPDPMERIAAGPAGRGFIRAPSGRPFTPWGVNYDRDHAHRLIEDYWETEWETVEEDFREIKALGANVVRVHLQFERFMKGPSEPNDAALGRLERLLELAEQLDLYLDLTGLGNYRKKASPPWYDKASEAERWAMQARFWDAVSARCAPSPAVFCYTLMNEPVSPAGPAPEWLPGDGLGGFHYVEHITKDPKGRKRTDVTTKWIATLSAPLRRNDPGRLVTAGMFFLFEVPSGLTLGQESVEILKALDFGAVHCYPKEGKSQALVDLLGTLRFGKPLLIQEMFPMHCSMETFDKFVTASRAHVSGWTGFYWGRTIEDMKGSKEFVDALMTAWLTWFRAAAKRED